MGRVRRGFENHISMLGDALMQSIELPFKIEVLGTKKIDGKPYLYIPAVFRDHWLLQKSGLPWHKRFSIEQASFLASLLPRLFMKKPDLIYLAEYNLYCWLFKIRSIFGLSYRLMLYTGGSAVPGLFDKRFDWVHHVTDEFWTISDRLGIPGERMSLIPHFVRSNFEYDEQKMKEIRQKAGDRKIVLLVGAIKKDHKRMDLAVKILSVSPDKVFVLMVGEKTTDTADIEVLLKESFKDAYLLETCSPEYMGTYFAVSDIFFSAADYEAFGLVYIEAMWHGLSMVCHRHHRLAAVVGDHAIAMNMDHVEEAKQKTQAIILNHQAGINNLPAHQFAEAHYSWTALQEQYVQMFCKALHRQEKQ